MILKLDKLFTLLSNKEKLTEDWLPIELRINESVEVGIVNIGPSLRKDEASKGLEEFEKMSSNFEGTWFWGLLTIPRRFNWVLPVLVKSAEIRVLDAAAKSSGEVNINFKAPDEVSSGEIVNLSPFWGFPLISIEKPSKFNLLPFINLIPFESLICHELLFSTNLALMVSCFIL